ncbi:MAG: maleylacetoacetate isomerase [Hyphomicrobiales bacterium]
MNETVLWDYPKSSACYRVRIGLNLAKLQYQTEHVNLLERAHRSPDHLARNPQGLVPVLDIDGNRLTQSLAILEYLDTIRNLGLLPEAPAQKAKARALAYSIAIDLHPVCNMSVANHATGGKEPARTNWMRQFIRPALEGFERNLLQFEASPIADNSTPSLADICLIPQLYNARRWDVDYQDLKRIIAIETRCSAMPAFQKAHPDNMASPAV